MRRNDQLTLLDDKFEKFFGDYEEDNVGGLEFDDLEGHRPENSETMNQMLKSYEKEMTAERQKIEDSERNIHAEVQESSGDEDIKGSLEIREVEEARRTEDKLDCESILTTYSTLYNHPRLIKEPSIKVQYERNLLGGV